MINGCPSTARDLKFLLCDCEIFSKVRFELNCEGSGSENKADTSNTHGAGLMDRKIVTLLYLWQHFNFNWTRPKLENKTET